MGISDVDKNIIYIDKALKLGWDKEAAVYIIRGLLFGIIWDYDISNESFVKAKALDQNLKYKYLYDEFGIY
jgi:hypothetical protein